MFVVVTAASDTVPSPFASMTLIEPLAPDSSIPATPVTTLRSPVAFRSTPAARSTRVVTLEMVSVVPALTSPWRSTTAPLEIVIEPLVVIGALRVTLPFVAPSASIDRLPTRVLTPALLSIRPSDTAPPVAPAKLVAVLIDRLNPADVAKMFDAPRLTAPALPSLPVSVSRIVLPAMTTSPLPVTMIWPPSVCSVAASVVDEAALPVTRISLFDAPASTVSKLVRNATAAPPSAKTVKF